MSRVKVRHSTIRDPRSDCWHSDKLTGPERAAAGRQPSRAPGKAGRRGPRGLRWGDVKSIRDALMGVIR